MKKLNKTGLRESLVQLPTPQLDAMLRAELEKEPPDQNTVKLILSVLREREADFPVESNAQIDRALEDYQEKTAPAKSKTGSTFLKAASVLIVCGVLLFALPQEANARSFFDRVAAWTESIFELFAPGDSGSALREYEFHTDHPGLQELYDTVTELGVTVPVVPMWLDEGYELRSCEVTSMPSATKVTAIFENGDKEAIFELRIYAQNIAREYHKDDPDAVRYESNGVVHNIMQNEGLQIVVWVTDNIESFIAIDCQERTLCEILDSIYAMEE